MTRTTATRLDALEATAVATAIPAAHTVVLDWIEPTPIPAGNYAYPNERNEAVAARLGIDPATVVRVTVHDMRKRPYTATHEEDTA